MKRYLRLFMVPLSCFIFISGCSTQDVNSPLTWEQKTIQVIRTGQVEDGYFDYNLLLNRKTSLDATWRYVEIKQLLNKSISDPRLVQSLHNYETSDLYYQLMINDLLTQMGDKNKYSLNANKILLQTLDDQQMTLEQQINRIYNILYFSNQGSIPYVSKIKIEKWLNQHKKEVLSSGVGYVFLDQFIRKTLDLPKDLNEEEKEKYVQELREACLRSDPDLIQIYYLFYINQFIGNPIDKKQIMKTLSLFESSVGSYGTKVSPKQGNSLGTHLVMKLLNDMNAIEKDRIGKILRFIEEKKSDNGMYFIDQIQKPDPVATLLAKRDLMLLGQDTTDIEQISHFLFTGNVTDWKYKYLGYSIIQNELDPANKKILQQEIREFWGQLERFVAAKSLQKVAGNTRILESIEYSVVLAKDIQLPIDVKTKKILIDLVNMNFQDFQHQNLFSLSINLAIAYGVDYQVKERESLIRYIKNQFDSKEQLFATDFITNYAAVKSLFYLNDPFTSINPQQIMMKFQSNQGGLCFELGRDETSSLVPTYLGLSLLNEIHKEKHE